MNSLFHIRKIQSMNNTITKKNSLIDKSNQIIFKIVVIGHSSVGKTSIIQRYLQNEFAMRRVSTVGVDCESKVIQIEGIPVKLQIVTKWDTAGQERFKSLTKNYYRGCDAILIVYDITNKISFDAIASWLQDFQDKQEKEPLGKLILANKLDLQKARTVSEEQGLKFANNHNFMFFEVSAKESTNIESSMTKMLTHMLKQKNLLATVQSEVKQLKRQKSQENIIVPGSNDSSFKSSLPKSRNQEAHTPVNSLHGMSYSTFSKHLARANSVTCVQQNSDKYLNLSDNLILRSRQLSEELKLEPRKLESPQNQLFPQHRFTFEIIKAENGFTEEKDNPNQTKPESKQQSDTQQFKVSQNNDLKQNKNQMKLVHPRISDSIKKKNDQEEDSCAQC